MLEKSINKILEIIFRPLIRDNSFYEEYVEQESKSEESSVRYVSMEEANSYLDLTQNIAHKMALGVAMCIMSPAIIITLSNLYLFEPNAARSLPPPSYLAHEVRA